MRFVELTVRDDEAGSRIDRMLGRRLHPEYSRSYLTCLVESGAIRVEGEPVRKSYRLEAGQTISLELTDRVDETPEAEDIPLTILHEDEHLIVVDKPEDMVIHPGVGTRTGTLVNALLHRYPELAPVGIAFRPGIVHRLDRDTSGVILVARSNLARYHLVEQFKNRQVHKEYRALVVGEIPYDSDYIDLPIGKDPKARDRMRVDRRSGKPASTYYEVLERFNGFTSVKCCPHTGRTHQIRVHLAHLGFPIIADAIYQKGKGQWFFKRMEEAKAEGKPYPRIERQALHAERITFTHPATGEETIFTAPLPRDMEQLLEWLKSECGRGEAP